MFSIIFHTTKILDLSTFPTLLCKSDSAVAALLQKVDCFIKKFSKVDTLERLKPPYSGAICFAVNKKKLCSGIPHNML